MQKELIQHAKIEDHPVATFVAKKDSDGIRFGVAICNTELDNYDKKTGLLIATGRADKYFERYIDPHEFLYTARSFKDRKIDRNVAMIIEYEKFVNRAYKYFKVDEEIQVIEA